MHNNFAAIGQNQQNMAGENSFWPSFTDIMMVITMIFLMATSLLVVRNWQLVAELQESITAEQIAVQVIESTSLVNATLEERLANAEQSNSILRLRLLKKEEQLNSIQASNRAQKTSIAGLEMENRNLQKKLQQSDDRLAAANLEINAVTSQYHELSNEITRLNQMLAQRQLEADQKLAQRQLENDQTSSQLSSAQQEIARLTASTVDQKKSIGQLTEEREQLALERLQLNQEIESYNQQLIALKDDYDAVSTKYEELIKPARSAQGKHIAEVYYIKQQGGEIIRYRQPGDSEFSQIALAEVERRLAILKDEHGKNLYIKIIIPEDSGLTYNEAWDFMRNLLVKFDYYYQQQ